MVKKITFNVSADGEVTLSVDGVKGNSCEDLSKPFEQVLGQVEGRELKDSYYQESSEDQNLSVGED